MTDQTDPKAPRAAFSLYQAELWVAARITVKEDPARAVLDLNGEALEVAVHPRLRPLLAGRLEVAPDDLPLACKLWPRTGLRARLRQEVCTLREVSNVLVEPRLLLHGLVKSVGQPEGCLRVTVHPNPGSDLRQPFDLTVLADRELLGQLERGQGVRVLGRLGADRRLMAESVEPVHLRRPRRSTSRAAAPATRRRNPP